MNPNLVTIYQCPFPKRRIGRWTDGGYAVADIPNMKYDALISGGVGNDISFEEDFIKYQDNPSMPVYIFDGTVDGLPNSEFQKQMKFTRKNIGKVDTDELTNLHSTFLPYIANNSGREEVGFSTHAVEDPMGLRMENQPQKTSNANLFVKMDIEGGEVDWISSLTSEHMNSIAQFVMEFHEPFSTKEIAMFTKINETHLPVHFHPNNACKTRIHNGVYFPNVFECTYLHKRFFGGEAELNRDFIPNDNVDVRNISFIEEIWMSHPPFVHFEKFVRKL